MNWILSCFIGLVTVIYADPAIRIDVSPPSPKQGDPLWVTVITNKPIQHVAIRFNKRAFNAFPSPIKPASVWVAPMGIDRYTAPQSLPLKTTVTFTDNSVHTDTRSLLIQDAQFLQENITLSPSKTTIHTNTKSRNTETARIGKGFRTLSPERYFWFPFIWPVTGRISSVFGTERRYNGQPGWKHAGIDIAQKTGTPLKATAGGRVILADALTVHGNTVMIDHGWGIVSIYNHMDTLAVQVNDTVTHGDIIGTVGATGVATGSHVHFGISIQGVRVDPTAWLDMSSTIGL
jgi:murein DD-endopeptidase MepM/ murein hydrolase activator NlpD